ncbi:MAG: HAMP domain-containing protein, partial [Gemmata sp.]
MSERPPLIVFADDWGRHPSSCQHLVARLLPHRGVTWVNTIGTRPPGLNRSTVTRGLAKLRQWAAGPPSAAPPGGAGGAPPSPVVLNPKMWPSFRSRFGRALNRRLLARALAPVAGATRAAERIGAGELDLDMPPTSGAPEVGRLLSALRAMR